MANGRTYIIVSALSTWLLAITGMAILTWANAGSALDASQLNKEELAKRHDIVYSTPHIEENLADHVEDFKDFRMEQRTANGRFDSKLDRLLINVGGSVQ